MHDFIKILISKKQNIIFGLIIILIILCTAYQLKLVGIAAAEDSTVIEMTETMETNTAQELESTTGAILKENNSESTEDFSKGEENTLKSDKENATEKVDTKESIIENEKTNITENTKVENDNLETNVEKEELVQIPTELVFNKEEYTVTVSAITEGALKNIKNVVVTPITNENNAEEYNDILYKLNQKVESENEGNTKKLAGFLAYDIKLIDDLGNEKEPDGNVNVSIEYKDLPDLVAKNSNLEVSVIHFDNSNDDGEKLVEYSQEEENLTIEKDNENQIKKLEFETDSFSTFTIAWTIDATRTANIKVHYVDSNGKEIQGSITDDITVNLDDIINLSNYIGTINNYIYKDAHYNSYDGELITSIGFKNNDIKNSNVDVNLYYKTKIFETFELDDENRVANIDLYLVYNKVGNLTIENDIKDNGVLKAILTDDVGNNLSVQNDNSSLVWYKCDTEKGQYSEVSRVAIAGLSDVFNISSDGTEINVALDQGARQYYKVQLMSSEGKILTTSDPVQVEYYDDVRNGGFEKPNLYNYNYRMG